MTDFTVFFILFDIGFGVCNGLTYIVSVHHGWLWYPGRPGLISGIIIGGFGTGPLIFNNLAAALVNPNNEQADDNGKFPDDVNARVPEMLRILSYGWMVCAACAIILIFDGPTEEEREKASQSFTLINGVNQIAEKLDGKDTQVNGSLVSDDKAGFTKGLNDSVAKSDVEGQFPAPSNPAYRSMSLSWVEDEEKKEKIKSLIFYQGLKSWQFIQVYLMAFLSICKYYFKL